MSPSEYDPNETARDWEVLQKDSGGEGSVTDRLRIKGGWLYRTCTHSNAIAMVFVPVSNDTTVE